MKAKNILSTLFLCLLITVIIVFIFKLQFFDIGMATKTTFFENANEIDRKVVISDDKEIENFLKATMININLASKEDILQIEGITEDTAKRIVNLRKYQKKIRKFEDLLKIKSMTKSEYQIICTNFYIE